MGRASEDEAAGIVPAGSAVAAETGPGTLAESAGGTGVGDDGTNPVRGALWMVGAMFSFTIMLVLIRYLSDRMSAIDIAFWRALVGIGLMLPYLLRGGLSSGLVAVKTSRVGLFALRGFFTWAALTCYIYAVANMVLVDAVALNSTIPLFTAVLAALVLRERVGPLRWVVTVIGFCGALIILRPGVIEIGWPAIAALVSACFSGATGITVKMLGRTEPASRIVFYTNVMLAAVAAIPAIATWNPPALDDLPLVFGIGASATVAHFCLVRAFAAADASFVAPFDFIRLVLVTFVGYFLFGETSSLWVWLGAIVIFASAVYLTSAEAQGRARAKAGCK